MQGKKQYQEKLFSNFQLSDHVPKENFYRRLTEVLGLKSYIPPHGQYRGGAKGFNYHKDGDYWECSEGKHVKYQKTFTDKGVKKNRYTTKRADCKDCPIKTACL